jgi:hypothetical protein
VSAPADKGGDLFGKPMSAVDNSAKKNMALVATLDGLWISFMNVSLLVTADSGKADKIWVFWHVVSTC